MDQLFNNVSSTINYFLITPLFQNNLQLYYIFFVSFILIFLLVITLLLISVFHKQKETSIIIKTLKILIPLLIFPFYIPFQVTFLSVFSCDTNSLNTYEPSIHCWRPLHIFLCVVGGLMSISFYFASFFLVITFFEIGVMNNSSSSVKFTSYPDSVALNIKTIYVILMTFLQDKDIPQFQQWITITFYLLISGFCFYQYYSYKPYFRRIVMMSYLLCYFISFWAYFILFVSIILEGSDFNGGIHLLFLGIILIFFMFVFDSKHDIYKSILVNRCVNELKILRHLFSLLNLSEKVQTDRQAMLAIKGYISSYEETCLIKNCPLKQILTKIPGKEINMSYTEKLSHFYQHLEIVCQSIIEQHPKFLWIRIFYSFFLITKLKKKQQALIQIKNCIGVADISLEKDFILFTFQNFISGEHLHLSQEIHKEEQIEHIHFNKELQNFKQTIKEVNLLYIDFWSILIVSNSENKENLDRLNIIGKKITQGISKIKKTFNSIQQLKNNDKEVLSYYSDFLLNVLNDKALSTQYKNILLQIENKDIFYTSSSSNEFSNENLAININAINSSDNNLFIVVSANQESFNIITNISLSICALFGYQKKDLVGKSLDILLPEFFIKSHRELLQLKTSEIKKNLISKEVIQYKNKEVDSFGITKSKYLIPITFKTGILYNENNEFSFIAKVFNNSFHTNVNQINLSNTDCFVMTSPDFIIQYFTPNSFGFLGLESECVNGNTDITEFIKEFNEEFFKCVVDTEEKTHKFLIGIKQKVQKTKFSKECILVTWKKNEIKDHFKKRKMLLEMEKEQINKGCPLSNLNNLETTERSEKKSHSSFGFKNPRCYLSIKDIVINETIIGFLFRFEPASEVVQKSSSQKRENFLSAKIPIRRSIQTQETFDKTYIPSVSTKFNLDLKGMRYTVALGGNTNNKRDSIKKLALNKLNLFTNVKKEETESSSSSSSSSYYSSYFEDGSVNESSKGGKNKTSGHVGKESGDLANLDHSTDKEDDFYHVDITKIKLLVYNYRKHAVEERAKNQFGSQVDYAKHSKEDTTTTEKDPNDKEYMLNHHFNDTITPQIMAQNSNQEQINNAQNEILLKQIDKALSKQESQPTIIRLGQASVLSILLIYLMGIGFMMFFLITFKNLLENLHIIQESLTILLQMILGQLYVRELILINNSEYTNNLHSTEDAIEKYKRYLLPLFTATNEKLTYIITTFSPFRESTLLKLSQDNILVSAIKDDFSITSHNLSIFSALNEINTALFHVVNLDISKIIPTQTDVYFFMTNSLNSAFFGLKDLNSLFIEELYYNVKKYQETTGFFFGGSVILLIICYIALALTYHAVAIRKESYLEVFFDIGKHSIEISLENCEFFNKKIQAEPSSSQKDSTSINSQTQMSIDEGYIEMLRNSANASNTNGSGDKTQNHRYKRKAQKITKESRKVKVKIFAVLFVIMIYLLAVFLFYFSYLNDVSTYVNMLENFVNLHYTTLYLYNFLKEFLFDSTQTVYNKKATELVNSILPNFYSDYCEKEAIITKDIKKFPKDFVDFYDQTYQNDICSYGETVFNETYHCEDLMVGIPKLGLKSLTAAYVEDIRLLKNYYYLYDEKRIEKNFTYNLTLVGTEYEKENFPSDPNKIEEYKKYNPIHIFNLWKMKELNIVLIKFLKPCFEELVSRMNFSLNNGIRVNNIFFLVIMISFLVLNTAWFFGIFVPFINKLNQIIYKTKNMLSIIPRQILCNIPNIRTVLGITNGKLGNNVNDNTTIIDKNILYDRKNS